MRALTVALVVCGACGSDPVPLIDAMPSPMIDAALGDAPDPEPVTVTILAFNDFHGALDPVVTSGVSRGGAAYLAAHIAALRTPTTLVVSAGDMIGGSPLVSGLFHDEATIEVMNALGLDYAGVGNHEFDEGTAELRRMQDGGCHPVDGCFDGPTFEGASFPFLAANVTDTTTGTTVFPGYAIRDLGGVKIAVVGMTLEDTPAVTLASAIPELRFADEVETMNALVPEIHAQGASIIVLALHQGGGAALAPNECLGSQGAVHAIAAALDPSVVMVAAGHSHTAFNCNVGGKLVTSAGSRGSLITKATLVVDPTTQQVISVEAENLEITDALAPDPAVAAIVDRYHEIAAPIGDRVIGTITADIRGTAPSGERPMGAVIADAMLEATAAPHATAAEIALMNPGGIRAPMIFARSGDEPVDGQVTYAEGFTVQPFSNFVSVITVTGTAIVAALDSALAMGPLQVAGMTYTYRPGAPPGSRVTASDVIIGGVPLDPGAAYRVTVNSIVRESPAFADATSVVSVGIDLDLLVSYFAGNSPVSPPAAPRITTAP